MPQVLSEDQADFDDDLVWLTSGEPDWRLDGKPISRREVRWALSRLDAYEAELERAGEADPQLSTPEGRRVIIFDMIVARRASHNPNLNPQRLREIHGLRHRMLLHAIFAAWLRRPH